MKIEMSYVFMKDCRKSATRWQ